MAVSIKLAVSYDFIKRNLFAVGDHLSKKQENVLTRKQLHVPFVLSLKLVSFSRKFSNGVVIVFIELTKFLLKIISFAL